MALEIVEPDFAIQCFDSPSLNPGESVDVSCTVQSINGFNSPVELSCIPPSDSGISCVPNPTVVTPPADGEIAFTLTISTSEDTVEGVRHLDVIGKSGDLENRAVVVVNVRDIRDFTLECQPIVNEIAVGQTAQTTCSVISVNGFEAPVNLTCDSPIESITCRFSPTPVTPPKDSSVTSTLVIRVDVGTPTWYI